MDDQNDTKGLCIQEWVLRNRITDADEYGIVRLEKRKDR